MLLIPAIDIKDGRCVRLRQGRMEEETVYDDDPLSAADRWVAAGTRRLHVVDLDGARSGRPANARVIRAIAAAHPQVPVQVGGGIRDEDAIDAYLDAGVSYIILGSKAVAAPHFVADVCASYPGHILVGLDARDGKVATHGWSKLSQHDVGDMARRFEREGVDAIIYTDITRDGMMTGINIESTVELARTVRIPIIASGGIRNLEDVKAICEVAPEGIIGAITGRAIYERTLDFAAGQKLADELAPDDLPPGN